MTIDVGKSSGQWFPNLRSSENHQIQTMPSTYHLAQVNQTNVPIHVHTYIVQPFACNWWSFFHNKIGQNLSSMFLSKHSNQFPTSNLTSICFIWTPLFLVFPWHVTTRRCVIVSPTSETSEFARVMDGPPPAAKVFVKSRVMLRLGRCRWTTKRKTQGEQQNG